MILQKQPNQWSCVVTSAAMILEIPVEQLIDDIGHDGSEILFPHLTDHLSRRSFHPQEISVAALKYGWACSLMEIWPAFYDTKLNKNFKIGDSLHAKHLFYIIAHEHACILFGELKNDNGRHAVACDNGIIYDPVGNICNLENYPMEFEMFMPFFKIDKVELENYAPYLSRA